MTKRQKIEDIVLFILLAIGYGLLIAFVIMKVDIWRVDKSREYLSEAKKSTNDSDRLILFEKAAVLNPGEDNYLNAGITALKLGDSKLAQKYLARVKTAEGYFQLANAYYNLGDYGQAAANYQNAVDKRKNAGSYLGLAKSFLKQGVIAKANIALTRSNELGATKETDDLLALLIGVDGATDPANRTIIVYNALNNLGYPQSAQKILDASASKGYLNRDSLLVLANEKIAAGDYQAAYGYLQRSKAIDPYYPQIYRQLVVVDEKLGKTDEAKQAQAFLIGITF